MISSYSTLEQFLRRIIAGVHHLLSVLTLNMHFLVLNNFRDNLQKTLDVFGEINDSSTQTC